MRKNKFNAKKTEYNGDMYDSKKEAEYARELDLAMHAVDEKDRVKRWERQLRFRVKIEGVYFTTYVLDFMVVYADNRVEYIDVKGYKKGPAYDLFKLKKKLVEYQYKIEIKEV
jgi:hypothetical protein